MISRIRPSTRIRIADAADAILAAAAIALMILAAMGVLTGSTALGLVPAPIGEPGLVPTPTANTTIRLYAANPDAEVVPVGHHLSRAVLAQRIPNESNHIPGRR
jgi:hypothetical protein